MLLYAFIVNNEQKKRLFLFFLISNIDRVSPNVRRLSRKIFARIDRSFSGLNISMTIVKIEYFKLQVEAY